MARKSASISVLSPSTVKSIPRVYTSISATVIFTPTGRDGTDRRRYLDNLEPLDNLIDVQEQLCGCSPSGSDSPRGGPDDADCSPVGYLAGGCAAGR